MAKTIDEKIADLFQITDQFIFPEYYSHTQKDMWKIKNSYTKWNEEIIVLCPVEEGIEKAIDLAIVHIGSKKKQFQNAGNN